MIRSISLLFLLLSATPAPAEPKIDDTFFDGTSLKDWKSTDMKFWSVEDGAIVGHADEAIPHNVFLWSPAEVRDFHLAVDIKITPDDRNAGVQFRSVEHGEFEALGYQADVGKNFWGRLYHESGRKMLDWRDRGEKAVKPGEWNHVEILAVGDRIWTSINGTLAVSVREPGGERSGKIAFQIHAGPPFTIHYKNPVLTHDPTVTLAGLDEEKLNAELVDLPPVPGGADASPPKFENGFTVEPTDVIAFLGGTDTVKLSEFAYLETLLTSSAQSKSKSKAHAPKFRDLAWQADTVFHRQRPLNFPSLPDLLKKTGTTIAIVQFGQMESLAGSSELPQFITAYASLLDEIATHTQKIVLVTPRAFAPNSALPHAPDLTSKNDSVTAYAAAIKDLAAGRGYLCVDLSKFPSPGLTADGIHLTPPGHWEQAREILAQLDSTFTSSPSDFDPITATFTDPSRESLRQLILTKNLLWRQHWRPTNWAFAYGDRSHVPSSHDHRPGHPRWFPPEIESILPKLGAAEQEIADPQ